MKRLGKSSNEIQVLLEGNIGKVMRAGKLLETVRFERGENLVEAINTLKKDHLLEGKDVVGFTIEGLEQVLDEIGKVPGSLASRIRGEYEQELEVDVTQDLELGSNIKVSITLNRKGFFIIFDGSRVNIYDVLKYMDGEGNIPRVADSYLSSGVI